MQYLYLIRCENFHKIGVAIDVESRIAQLSTGNPFPLFLDSFYKYENAEFVERAIHQRFSLRRVRGEWFKLDADDLKDFHDICALLGGEQSLMPVKQIEENDIAEAEENQETDEMLVGGISWRLEKRNDRNPHGFVIFKRGGVKEYLGYINSKTLADPLHPTVEEVEDAIKSHCEAKQDE